ncbi:MAG: D-alanyl-D-alanine carboxypeptidase [Clostridia bacterium]|nr:D-alanyl-D-alanine carboxypeptidase [Clostridia bacterium]
MKKLFTIILCFLLFTQALPVTADAPSLSIKAKACLLMEASTGQVLYESNIHEKLPPASVTKIMTMLLTMEAIDRGQIAFEDIVTASENAKRMGGSTIFLDTGEQMSVYDLMKGIAVASGNDACVAMAEYLSGSESAFVERMNARAAELGMADTHFVNCNGLPCDGHVTSAYDIALMSRALLAHERIFEFTTIWVDSLRGGKFALANTNKLIRFYEGANGLKTGSTDDALYCLSATAKRNDMQLIAVILGAPTTKDRFNGARALLDYGFATYSLSHPAESTLPIQEVPVEKGTKSTVGLRYGEDTSILLEKEKLSRMESRVETTNGLTAPVKAGDAAGTAQFYADGNLLGTVPLVAAEDVPRKSFGRIFLDLLQRWSGVYRKNA